MAPNTAPAGRRLENGQNDTSGNNYGGPSAISEVPITQDRPVPEGLEEKINNPGMPRATKAISAEKPNGSEDSPNNRTVLQQHVDFWDEDKDGIIWPLDTYRGFRKIGAPVWMSFLAIFFIHGSFSYPSCNTWLPDPFFRIFTKHVHRCKHGSDSEVYDTEGRFVPQKFEELFSKHDKGHKDGLTLQECWRLTEANRNIIDPTGWTAEKLEWGVTYYLLANDQKLLPKESIRGCYDGSIFFQKAAELERKKQNAGPKKSK